MTECSFCKIIAGEIEGNMTITEHLELLATSQVKGDLSAKTISVAPGAKLNGRVSMQEGAVVAVKEKKEEKVEEYHEEPALS